MFYQLAGFGSEIEKWFDRDRDYQYRNLSQVVYKILADSSPVNNVDFKKEADVKKEGSSAIELVLGITSKGASYVLLTEQQMLGIQRVLETRNLRSQISRMKFASLSPIYFNSGIELQKKLSLYKCNFKGPKNEDNSVANKGYRRESPARAYFEQQRLLWHVINNSISKKKFLVCDEAMWVQSMPVISFSYNDWRFKLKEERRADPIILEIGLASLPCQAFTEREDYRSQIRSSYITIKENQIFNGERKAPYLYGDEEILTKEEIKSRLNGFFDSLSVKRALFLVFDAEWTESALKKLGIDSVIYEGGVEELLYGPDGIQGQQPSRRYMENGESSTNVVERERSQSPRWRNGSQPFPRSRSPKIERTEPKLSREIDDHSKPESRSGSEERKPLKLYLIDIRSIFLTVSGTDKIKSPIDLASRLGISISDDSPCAGNASHLLIEAWVRMSSGKAIDEQSEELKKQKILSNTSSEKIEEDNKDLSLDAAPMTVSEAVENSDEEEDPNVMFADNYAPRNDKKVEEHIRGEMGPPIPEDDNYDSDQSFG